MTVRARAVLYGWQNRRHTAVYSIATSKRDRAYVIALVGDDHRLLFSKPCDDLSIIGGSKGGSSENGKYKVFVYLPIKAKLD